MEKKVAMKWLDIFRLFKYAFTKDPLKDYKGGITSCPDIVDLRNMPNIENRGAMLKEADFIKLSTDEEFLGHLAMDFRDASCKVRHYQNLIGIIKQDYAQTVDRLIKSGKWEEIPPPEDQLPQEHMPESFWQYWKSNERP